MKSKFYNVYIKYFREEGGKDDDKAAKRDEA